MEKEKLLILWRPFQGHSKGQRKEIPRSQASDSWNSLRRKQAAGKGSEWLIFSSM